MKNKNRIFLFCIVTGLFWFSLYTYVPTLPTYAKSLGASYKLVGLIIGSYGFTQMLLRIPLGILSDRLNMRRIFITLGVILCFISSFGMWSFQNPLLLLAFRAVSGAAAAAWVPVTVLFSSYFKSEEAPKAIGFISSVTSTGQVAAIFFGGLAAEKLNSRAPFLLAFVGAVIAIILSFSLKENKSVHREPIKLSALFAVAKSPGLLLFSILAIFTQYMTFATMYGFTPVAAKQLGATDFQLGLLTMLSTMPGIFGALLSGTFFSRHPGEKNTLVYGFLMSTAACVTIPFIKSLPLLYITQMLGGFALGTVFPLLMGMCIRNVQEHTRASAMGFFQAIYGIGMFMGPTVVGILSDIAGLAWGFWTTGMVGLVAMFITLRFVGREDGRTAVLPA